MGQIAGAASSAGSSRRIAVPSLPDPNGAACTRPRRTTTASPSAIAFLVARATKNGGYNLRPNAIPTTARPCCACPAQIVENIVYASLPVEIAQCTSHGQFTEVVRFKGDFPPQYIPHTPESIRDPPNRERSLDRCAPSMSRTKRSRCDNSINVSFASVISKSPTLRPRGADVSECHDDQECSHMLHARCWGELVQHIMMAPGQQLEDVQGLRCPTCRAPMASRRDNANP